MGHFSRAHPGPFRLAPGDALASTIASFKADTGEDLGSLTEVQDMLRLVGDRIQITGIEREAQRLSLRVTSDLAPWFLRFNWCLCSAPSGSFFITSDAPACVFVLEADGRAILGGGLGRRDAEVILPLSPDVCLLLSRKHAARRMAVGKEAVRGFNRRTAAHSERFIISPYRAAGVAELTDEWRHTRQRPKLDPEAIEKEMRQAVAEGMIKTGR